MNKPALATSLAILLLVIIFIFTKSKQYNYKKINSIEYNSSYNEKHPIIDTIQPYYKNVQPIFVRDNMNVGGHEGIGSINGGSIVIFICNSNCPKCKEK